MNPPNIDSISDDEQITLKSLTNDRMLSELYHNPLSSHIKEKSIERNTIKLNYNDICIDDESNEEAVIVIKDLKDYENVYN